MKKYMNNHKKVIISLGIVAAIASLAYLYRNDINNIFETLSSGTVDDLVTLIQSWGIGAPIVSILLMILQAYIAPIPSFLIAGANGLVFGTVGGIIISWIGGMLGAMGTFYLARLLGSKFVKKFVQSNSLMEKVDEISQKHGTKVVFIGRLLPFISFDFLSYAAGLSTMKPWRFFLATAIGMIPGTAAYVLLGNQILKYSRYTNQMFWITIVLILVFIVYSKIKRRIRQES
ncbi:TVP38/TMEM64 family protein [Petrocella sp. FN5]|uniref:TVP38/TMEM64 family protein n=1 Tax=Petrocella sp. FN5 TaxID=3032002 RepID=UPI0023DBA7F4|nr:TVP38/TMEM64 family protein [Petrocella sp. FN5]MDF1616935.1 TVP38/TMEM64 family protein [Petrocella sp. FN5]